MEIFIHEARNPANSHPYVTINFKGMEVSYWNIDSIEVYEDICQIAIFEMSNVGGSVNVGGIHYLDFDMQNDMNEVVNQIKNFTLISDIEFTDSGESNVN